MKIEDITDDNLREFLDWYKGFHGNKPVATSVMTTCMTGYFKTFSKAADKLLARCKRLRIVDVKDGMVTMPNN